MQTVVTGDCLSVLPSLPAGAANLIFADPPFNIDLEYRGYDDALTHYEYRYWTERWLQGCVGALSPSGSIFVQISDEWAPWVHVCLESLGMHWRNTIIWYYRFGPYTKTKYGRNHQQILYFVANPDRFTFNADVIRVSSDRQTKYGDKRADAKGRVPGDVWEFPRVCGTFKRRVDHVCQTPTEILDRIILAHSNPGDLVLDPFAGSGTAGEATKRHGRRYLGIELSEATANVARERLSNTKGAA